MPIAIPPKAMWARESPNRDCLLSTRNNPITEQTAEIAIPAISARCMKPNSKISQYIILALKPY